MTLPEVEAICREKGITITPPNRYPKEFETRSVAALNRIYAKHGAAHLSLVLETAVHTENNAAALEGAFIWAISDLLSEFRSAIDADKENGMSRWFEVFDKTPVDQMVFYLSGRQHRRFMLKGMLWERVRAEFADQPELFQERAA